MAIRQWHPLKLGIIWLIDLAILLILWLLASPVEEDQSLMVVVWLIISIPTFIITWKWAGSREGIDLGASTQDAQSNKVLMPFRRDLKGFSQYTVILSAIMAYWLVAGMIGALIFYYPGIAVKSYLPDHSSTELAVIILGVVFLVRIASLRDWIPRAGRWMSFKIGLLKLLFKP
jgi:hypothetical protein